MAVELRPEHFVVGLGAPQLRLGLEGLLGDLGIAELQQDRVCVDPRARLDPDPLDATVAAGRDPGLALGHQRARAPHLTQHLAALDRGKVESVELNLRSRRLESCQRDRGEQQNGDRGHQPQRSPPSLLSGDIASLHVHDLVLTGR